MRGKVHYRIDLVLIKNLANQLAVAGIADHELAVQNCLAKACRQIVQDDDSLIGFAQLSYDMTTNVARSACNKDGTGIHLRSL